eukprot:TRINITY_DN2342_c0_g1_i1.p1 TRINITY_DN2342_c0_g1~~TRINITY_DN2342_c0_g1_i1.p1  ORF type:complete len:480 (+),score=126.41 TRINITY_DN2342_c0_g1_i1:76-1515(+)
MLRRSCILLREYRNVIAGELVAGPSTYPVLNPATGAAFADAPVCTQAMLDTAVAAARDAQKPWGAMALADRRAALLEAQQKMQEHSAIKEITETLVREQGKPMAQAEAEVKGSLGSFGLIAKKDVVEERVLSENDKEKIVERRVPLGVVGGITPWNFPVLMAAWKIAEALIAGNSIVLKPSPYTPLSTLVLGEVLRELLPAGLVNIVSGPDLLGRWLTDHDGIAKISFTGSTATGKAVQASAARTLKRVTLELGGNDAAVVLDDVDAAAVAKKIFQGAFANSGQVCTAIKRVYVHRSKFDAVVAGLTEEAKAVKVGEGTEEGVFMGPLNNEMQLGIVKSLVAAAKESGATVHCGGEQLDRPGYFFPPTIVTGVGNGDTIVDKEQFGPVLPVVAFDEVDEVVSCVNDTSMGLGGSVWSADVGRATAVASRIDSGTVWVNCHMRITPDVPFGGAKQSGIGHQLGNDLEGNTQAKILRIAKV